MVVLMMAADMFHVPKGPVVIVVTSLKVTFALLLFYGYY